ncbi:phosphatidylinositol 4-kinase [Endozoicomonas sp. ONNA2]|uniref:phosphatidylinositol 4-kinase n=1 Tax=Endozoicomonas sp. ONNA2 TaxID=2828741 RepID=UPI00214984AF|nr:phosphatidylinositol 4-kinase [Endozoicomonas sp. ONNA2]
MIPPDYPSGNQPPVEVKKDFAKAPPVVPQTRSSMVSERVAFFTQLAQRTINPVVTDNYLTKPPASPVQTTSPDSGYESDGEPSPVSSAAARTAASKPMDQIVVKLTFSEEFQGACLKPLPPSIKVAPDALNDTPWLDQFLSKEDQQWVDVLFVQEGKAYPWVKGQMPGFDPLKPIVTVLNPSQAYKTLIAGKIKHPVSNSCDYQWFDRSALQSPEQQVLSVYQGKRPAAALEFPSTLDPRIGSAELFPGLATRVLTNPFGQGVTVIAERRNNPQGKMYGDRLEVLVKKQWSQAQADIARGVPKDVALFQSHIRNLQKRGELELIKPDCIRQEIIRARDQLSANHRSVNPGQLTPEQLAERKKAMAQRVTQRFNQPGVTQQQLRSLATHTQGSKPLPGKIGRGNRELRASKMISYYEQQLATEIPIGHIAAEQAAKHILTRNEKLRKELSEVIREHTDHLNESEINSLKNKISELRNDQQLLFQVLDSPALTSIAGKISWQAAMEFKRVGYDLNDELTLPGQWTDGLLDPHNPPRKLGAGNENTVYLLSYKTGNGTVKRVFKPEPAIDFSGFRSIISPELYHNQWHPNLTARNLATGEIARLLGMNVMPDMSFCEHDHQIGLEMELASGQSAKTLVSSSTDPAKVENLGYQELIDVEGNWETRNKIFSGLADLELLDAICAQPDRHGDNFFIDYETGRVTGIDNDTCLYPFRDIIAPSADQKNRAKWRKGCRVGYPRLMTRKSYDRLQQLDVDMLCESLPACFDLRVRRALRKRVFLIQEHSLALFAAGRIVDDWESWRDPTSKKTAIEFLTMPMADIVNREQKALKEEERRIEPILSKYHANEPLSDGESDLVWRYLWRNKLLSNDELIRGMRPAEAIFTRPHM